MKTKDVFFMPIETHYSGLSAHMLFLDKFGHALVLAQFSWMIVRDFHGKQ